MAIPKECVADIPSIYRADTIDHILFGYIRGCRSFDANRSIANIIQSFLHDFNLDDTFDPQSAMVAYQRINAKFRENESKL